MHKLYGFKESDAKELIKYLKENKGKNLTKIFTEFALIHNKSKGTIRNLYYAIAKKSEEDKEFCAYYLDGKNLNVNKITAFNYEDEKVLVKKILIEKSKGRSVRSAINELADGDMKLALRYQNKFRNAIKKDSSCIKEAIKELRQSKGYDFIPLNTLDTRTINVSDGIYKKLKTEIDSLVDRISKEVKRENLILKEKIAILEEENLKLKKMLFGASNAETAIKFLSEKEGENILS